MRFQASLKRADYVFANAKRFLMRENSSIMAALQLIVETTGSLSWSSRAAALLTADYLDQVRSVKSRKILFQMRVRGTILYIFIVLCIKYHSIWYLKRAGCAIIIYY